jgi:hypothetical protein
MSLEANIEHLKSANGIDAVLVRPANAERCFRGEGRWSPILDQALDLFTICGQTSMRLVVGSYTIVVQEEGGEIAAVALPTGHPIAKSLRRMIRRMSRKIRPPIEQARSNPFSVRTGLASTSSFSRFF